MIRLERAERGNRGETGEGRGGEEERKRGIRGEAYLDGRFERELYSLRRLSIHQ